MAAAPQHRFVVVASLLLLTVALALVNATPDSTARATTPTPGPPLAIASEVLGRATPVAVSNPELALGRVTIMPGAVIPVHTHPGTQIGVVVQGLLSYAVYSGEVTWQHGEDRAGQSSTIRAGETVVVRPGDALIETPHALHQGWNDGEEPVVIYLSTLLPADAPRAIVAAASPIP